MKKILVLVFITCLLIGINFSSNTNAAINFTVSPIVYELEGFTGTTITRPASIRNNSNTGKTLYTTKSDFQSNGESGIPAIVRKSELVYPDQQLSTWITLSETGVYIAPGEEKTIYFDIDIPSDATPGGHYGSVLFQDPKAEHSGGSNVAITVDYGILILLNIDGNVITEGEPEDIVVGGGVGGGCGYGGEGPNCPDPETDPEEDDCIIDLTPSKFDGKCIDNPFGGDDEPDPDFVGSIVEKLIENEPLSRNFEGLEDGGTGPYTYSWNFGDGSTGVGKNIDHIFPEAGEYTVNLVITDSEGHTTTVSKEVKVFGVEITGSIIEKLDDNDSESRDFEGVADGGSGPYDYSWNFGDGESGTGKDVSHKFPGPGEYTVALEVTDSEGNTAIVIKKITIGGIDFIGSIIEKIVDDEPESRDFEGVADGGNGPYTYTWDFGDGTDSEGENIEHKFPGPGTYEVTLEVTDSDGNKTTITKEVTIGDSNFAGSIIEELIEDDPKSRKFEGVADGGNGPYTYSWDFGDGTDGVGENIEHKFPGPGTYEVTLEVTDSDGNKTTITKEVTIGDADLAGSIVEKLVEDKTNSRVFEGVADGGDGPYTYVWDFGDGSNGVGEKLTHEFPGPGTYTVILKITDSEDNTTTVTKTITITDSDLTGSIIEKVDELDNKSRYFEGIASGGNGPYTYVWDFSDGSFGEGENINHQFNEDGVYIIVLKITDSDGNIIIVTKKVTIGEVKEELLEAFDIKFKIPFNNKGNTHLVPKGKIRLIDEDGREIRKIGKEVIINKHGAIIGERVVDYIPINDQEGNILPRTKRVFEPAWKGFPYHTYDEQGNKVIRYWSPDEYYTQQNLNERGYLMFWERICERKQHKKITALIDLSYQDYEDDTVEFSSAHEFYIDYTEQYIGINPYVVIIGGILGLIVFGFIILAWISKRRCVNKKCRKRIKKDMKICPYCGTEQNKQSKDNDKEKEKKKDKEKKKKKKNKD